MSRSERIEHKCSGCGGTGRDWYVDKEWLDLTDKIRWVERPHLVCKGTGRLEVGR